MTQQRYKSTAAVAVYQGSSPCLIPYSVVNMATGTAPDIYLSPNSASGTATPTTNGPVKAKGIVVFSGGSAANNLVDVFKTVREDKRCPLSYVIPISDNGGSSSELIRVFGGPG